MRANAGVQYCPTKFTLALLIPQRPLVLCPSGREQDSSAPITELSMKQDPEPIHRACGYTHRALKQSQTMKAKGETEYQISSWMLAWLFLSSAWLSLKSSNTGSFFYEVTQASHVISCHSHKASWPPQPTFIFLFSVILWKFLSV